MESASYARQKYEIEAQDKNPVNGDKHSLNSSSEGYADGPRQDKKDLAPAASLFILLATHLSLSDRPDPE